MTYNAHKQSCMSPHSDNNKSHHIMWLMGLPTLRQCCFFPALVFFLCIVLLRTSRCQATGGHDNSSEDKSTSPSFFFSWNLSYVMRDGTSVAIQQPSRKLPKKRQICQLISLSPSAVLPLCPSKLLGDFYKYFLSLHGHRLQEGEREGTWPWCWKWIQCALVFIYDLTNELPVSSETALKERLGRQAIKRLWRPLKCCKIPLSLQFNLLLTAQHQTREWQYLDHALNLDAMTGRCCVWEVRKCKWLLDHTVQPPPFVQAKLRWPLIWGTFQTRVY